jgi:hypothetical protein
MSQMRNSLPALSQYINEQLYFHPDLIDQNRELQLGLRVGFKESDPISDQPNIDYVKDLLKLEKTKFVICHIEANSPIQGVEIPYESIANSIMALVNGFFRTHLNLESLIIHYDLPNYNVVQNVLPTPMNRLPDINVDLKVIDYPIKL